MVGELQAGSVLGRISIPFLAAIAVVKEVESILRVMLAATFSRAAGGALGRCRVEECKSTFNWGTSVTDRAVRAFLTAFRTSYTSKKHRVNIQ